MFFFSFMDFFFQVNVPTKKTFSITNETKEKKLVDLSYAPDEDCHVMEFVPSTCNFLGLLYNIYFSVTIQPRETIIVSVSFTMRCTAKIKEGHFNVTSDNSVGRVSFTAESGLSCFVSVNSIKMGKLIGSGAYLTPENVV